MSSPSRLSQFAGLSQLGIHLLAVSKGQPASEIRSLFIEGQIDFGESRLQEALTKFDVLNDLQEIRWHFIGRLQANKVRGVVKSFDVIHSVDSIKLAKRISRIAGEENKMPLIMFQVKFRKDDKKTGFEVDELLEAWTKLITLPNVRICGLMTIPPAGLDRHGTKNLFKECRNLADQLSLQDCSMGMSRDWEDAIEAGATWIRLGSIFVWRAP